MADFLHPSFAQGRWFAMPLDEQLGNVGSEVCRAVKWHKKGDNAYRDKSLDRAFELLDLTIADKRWRGPKLKELCRARGLLADMFYGKNECNETPEKLEKYFYYFAYAARRNN